MARGSMDGQVSTPLDELRALIWDLEIAAHSSWGDSQEVLDLLELRSRIEVAVGVFEENGRDLRAESSRLGTIDNMLSSQASAIVRKASAARLKAVRDERELSRSHWWWWLDETVSADRHKRWIKTGSIFAGVTAVLLVASFVLNTFFGMSALEKTASRHRDVADQYMTDGLYGQAIVEYELALDSDPTLSQAMVALGVLHDQAGDETESKEALTAAREALGSESLYELEVARVYEKLGQIDQALAHADQAIALNPNFAQAYLIRGGIFEAAGERGDALADLERSFSLAQEQGEDQLYVLAKMRYGMLLQQTGQSAFAPGTP